MSRRCVWVAVAVFAAATGACETKRVGPGGVGSSPAAGDFSDSPMVGFIPADTPYAFASFKPVSLDFVRSLARMFGPIMRRSLDADIASGQMSKEDSEILEWLGAIDARQFNEHGFSTAARFAIYGIGPYPVLRVELSNGDKVFELVQRLAARAHEPLPAPTVRAGRRYWTEREHGQVIFVSIARKELVVALAPQRVIDGNLAALLGEQRPANSLTTPQFRELAGHGGFTGQGVGFVDVVRTTALAADAARLAPACRAAIAEIAGRVPRLVMGFDDFTAHHVAFGVALELAPDLQAELRGLSSELVGYERLHEQRPMMAIALAMNPERGRALASRIASALHTAGERCREPRLVVHAEQLAGLASRPVPPMFAGLRGGFLAVSDLEMGPGGPTSVAGYGLLQGDHIEEIVKLAASQVPGFQLQPDGKAREIPAMIPYRGHVAANTQALGIALGGGSATTVVEIVNAKSAPAPLALLQFDYSRFVAMMVEAKQGFDDTARDLIGRLGFLTGTLSITERGPSCWMSFELR